MLSQREKMQLFIMLKNAQIIIGPIGFVFANSMYGEVSPAMAAAISCSEAKIFYSS